MASLVVSGDTSGAITLSAPAVAGTNTLSLPAVTDTLVGLDATQTLTNKTLTSPTFGGTPTGVGVLTSGTAVNSTSGTSIDFTGIPSWVKRVTLMFNGVSTNATSNWLVQIGAGSVTTSGYSSGASSGASSVATTTSTAGFIIRVGGAGDTVNGQMSITNITGNTWVSGHAMGGNAFWIGGGNLNLGGTLDQVRITTVAGTSTFDAGSINILYE